MQQLQPRSLSQLITDDAIPNIQWDKRLSRYRFRDTGKLVSAQAVQNLTRLHIEKVEGDLKRFGDRLIDRTISLRDWQQETRRAIKQLHLSQALLVRGGQANMTSADYLQVGRTVKDEYRYLRQFAVDVRRGYSIGKDGKQIPMTEARFGDRLSKYAQHSRLSYELGERQNYTDMGYRFEQRLLAIAKHCNGCIVEAGRGVQPIGQLRAIGSCECGGRCKCSVRYYKTKP